MADHIEAAKECWHYAQKVRKQLQKELEKLKNDSEGNELKRFEFLESIVSSLRLACIQVIFHSFEYGTNEKVDANLWQAHSLVNTEYRKALLRLKGTQHNVLKRKLDKMYIGFLKTAQGFYIAYIQRLAAVFPIPELLRIAEGIKAENLVEENPIANVTPIVRQCILKFCHAALIHLGDLSRYRTQNRPKVPYEAALTYYSLAHDIIPTSGFAHHQMGIIYLDEKKHLDIIYHFYRALAIDEPHPMASQNLEAELKTLQQPPTPARRAGAPPDPQEAFVLWFVRLHAYFYKGEPFPQHQELEDEVIHRLEMATKAPNTRELLQKMVLLNMSAFYHSNRKMTNKWSVAASRSSHFVLRLNARFFSTFCRLLKKEVDEALEQQTKGEQSSADSLGNKEADKVTPLLENILPFMRLYAAWLVACRVEILNAQDALEPFIKDMYKGFAKALTVLCEMYGNENLKLTPYMLPEDEEAIGMRPLYDSQLPESCRLHYDEDSQVLKPQAAHYGGQRFDNLGEAFARVLSTIKCGFFLASDDTNFPFSYASSPKGLNFTFQEDYVPKASVVEPKGQPKVEQSSPVSVPAVDKKPQQPKHVQKAPSKSASSKPPPEAAPPRAQQHPTPGRNRTRGQSDYDFSSDTDMLNMVNDFLMPPAAHHESPIDSPDDTSYGMNSTMANEVFGVPQTNSPPALGSATAKTFPSLPWNMIYTPTPHSKNSELTPPDRAARDAAARRSFDAGALKSNVQVSNSGLLDDPFGDGQESQYMAHQQQQQQQQRYAGTPDGTRTAHQDRLLQAFGKQPVDPRPMARDFSSGYGLWPNPYAEGNPNVLLPRAASTHARSLSGSRPQYPQSPVMPLTGENFPLSSGSQFSNTSGMHQSTPCNGIAYTATTAFGRGPIAHMQEDPTHYKNLVRNNGGAATDGYTAGYNDMILQSAMVDEMRRASGQNLRR
ncbi:telomerase activating protein est1 [Colletotrichum truncatum]|uniref:Telomerase activating protein est1 n=1 Tax=Colletotrichum truncatum TaxID=5467 RepID=A0ACC3YGD9_COLTU|nr:telomerase activating protein est1 [Colletotrichum truncatum]KAF6785475.1 telomerase activating protein est1 [Colletotrichum truncatum]